MADSDPYPQRCAFCPISTAYPHKNSSDIPKAPDPEKVDPQCFLILSSPYVLAFLDILPIAPAHVLVTTRKHYTKISDLNNRNDEESIRTAEAIGKWIPVLSRALCTATGIEDWNVVQNNGPRAAQVVPHIHFHLIPRYQEGRKDKLAQQTRGKQPDWGTLRNWTMFGRGARTDLDEDEGRELAGILREALRAELGEQMREGGRTSVEPKL